MNIEKTIPNNPKWFSQRDSVTGQGGRMCDSSTHAMSLYYLKPALAKDRAFMGSYDQFDDAWMKLHVNRYGDTTNPHAQVAAMRDQGIKIRFSDTCNGKTIIQQVDAGFGLRAAILIHDELGNLDPECGHWVWIVGYVLNAKRELIELIVHDPAGELMLIPGGYDPAKQDGRFRRYSWRNFQRRWLCNQAGVFVGGDTGWGTIIEK